MKNIYLILNADGEMVAMTETLDQAIDYVTYGKGINGVIINADGKVLYLCYCSKKYITVEAADGSVKAEFRVNPRRADGRFI